jgi:LPXTG-site transpeptidase (sortase) family protein
MALVFLTAAIVLAVACGGGDKKASDASAPGNVATPQVFEATLTPATPEAEAAAATPAAPEFPAPKDDARLARLIISTAKIDAPFQVKGRTPRGDMENPDGKDNVAWYDFTGRPGFGSNAVLSGHVDWYTGEKGVFWHLRDLKEGDEVVVKLSDGMELKYKVVHNDVYKTEQAPVEEILGPTAKDSITMITCDGTFDRRSQDYSNRRVVRAERVG